MLRTFSEHMVRPVRSLNGPWDLVVAPERKDTGALPRRYTRQALVPSAWEALPGLEGFRGQGWMRRRFCVSGDTPVRFVFGGVCHTATVFVDGKKVAKHYDGFVPWDVVVTGLTAGEHEIVLAINNTFGKYSALHVLGDHYSSGGIIRPVAIEEIPSVFIDKVFATPVRRGRTWSLDLRVRVRNIGRRAEQRDLHVSVAGQVFDFGQIDLAGGETLEVEGRLAALRVKPWSAERSQLYDLTAQLLAGETIVDDLIDRVGFRDVRVKGSQILLNGQPLRLRGYNRHEYHGQFAQSLPVEAMAHDVQLLKDLGCNFIRTSHYPNDMRMLDLCDEMGLYVWEETNSTSVSFKHPKYTQQITADATSMVEWHFNRPSVIIWATLNECDAKSKAGRKEHGRMLDLLRTLDGSRLVTYASCAWRDDICLDLPDIVSWNWYTGWYWGSIETIQQELDEFLTWQDSHSKGKGKPVIISEFGAGAFYGYRSKWRVKWTEEFQADVLDELLRVSLHHPRVSGTAIWQFCDVRISSQGDWNHRPRCFNNKGTVDDLRRPKLAYEAVKKRMHEAARRFKRSGG